MPLTRTELDTHLAHIEKMVPEMLEDRCAFPRLFEDQVEILLGQLPESEYDYALSQLDTIVERSGYNP